MGRETMPAGAKNRRLGDLTALFAVENGPALEREPAASPAVLAPAGPGG
jgi:hypothetical protein